MGNVYRVILGAVLITASQLGLAVTEAQYAALVPKNAYDLGLIRGLDVTGFSADDEAPIQLFTYVGARRMTAPSSSNGTATLVPRISSGGGGTSADARGT